MRFTDENTIKALQIDIMLDKRIFPFSKLDYPQISDPNILNQWETLFATSSQSIMYKKEYVAYSPEIMVVMRPSDKTTSKIINFAQYQLDKLPIMVNINSIKKTAINIKEKDLNNSDMMVCSKIWEKIYKNWKIQLIIDKIYSSMKNKNAYGKIQCSNSVDWDNNNRVYITCHFIPDLNKLKQSDIKDINGQIQIFLETPTEKRGGGADAKSYIIDNVNACVSSDRANKFLSDFFIAQTTITKNVYYNNILSNISNFYISNGYNGIEYLIMIDSSKGNIYYTTSSFITNKAISSTYGLCLLSAVKYKNEFIIKKVIISDGKYIIHENIKSLNIANKKFGDFLKHKYITYDKLTEKNYKTCLEKHRKNIGDESDFIALSQINTPHFKSTEYRWSDKKIPIIFYCRLCPVDYISNYPAGDGELYILFLTNNKNNGKYIHFDKDAMYSELFGDQNKIDGFFTPIYFSPSNLPNAFLFWSPIPDMDKSYVSLTYDFKKHSWNFIEKANRSDTGMFGDNFKDVELNAWNNYRNPVSIADLTINKKEIASQMYFLNQKQTIHEAPIKMNNFIKRSLINNNVESNATVIDLGGGRGSDLWTYVEANVSKLLIAEIDKDAIDELIVRKYQVESDNNFDLNVINVDLNTPHKNTITEIKTHFTNFSSSGNIFCFFALHYLTDTIEHVRNISALIGNLLKKDGKFIYTAFDEARVMDLLKKHKGKWTIHQGGKKKYEIILEKTKNRNSIKLILPFNSPDYYYHENLINDAMLDKEFLKCGLKLERESNFIEFIDKFKEKKKFLYDRLTDDDKIFIGLYKYKTYRKK